MAMNPRTGRSRISKSDGVSEKISSRVTPAPSGRSRVSKADEIAKKIPVENRQSSSVDTRRRPASKVDQIEKKIPHRPAEVRAPEERIPDSKPTYSPTAQRRSGCCLLPFALVIGAIAGALIIIF